MRHAPFRLSEDQIRFFNEEGWLMVEDLFDPEADLGPAIGEINAVVNERARKAVSEGRLSQTYAEAGFERQLALINKESDQVARSLWNGSLFGPEIFGILTHPRLLDVARQLCRTEELIASSVYRLRPKVPNYGYGAVPWHQDSGYLDPFCDDKFILTVWLPLVDATIERGCLHVMPRRHQHDILRHRMDAHGWYLEIPDDALPQAEVIPVPVPKGGALLMTNRTPHASFENASDVVRWSMDLRYQSASLPTNAAITRTDAEKTALEADDAPLACYPPEPDFLVSSKLRPDEVIRTPEAFIDLRKNHKALPVMDRWAGKEIDWSHMADQVKRDGLPQD